MKNSLALALILSALPAFGAATIVIQNSDPAGVGFNDPTPVAPVGGNAGTTLGQQRLNAFQAAADIWGASINSTVTITIDAAWISLPCAATGAVLGSAGATTVWSFTSGPGIFLNTWYPAALANKFYGSDLDSTTAEIIARFNVDLGQTGCLTGTFFYLGLDNNHGANVDLMTVLLHEFAHGLGFQAFTDSAGGNLGGLYPSVFNHFQIDNTTGKTWDVMTDAERATSGLNFRKVAWNGPNVVSAAPSVLAPGTPHLNVTAPSSLAGPYEVGTAAFGPVLGAAGLAGEVMPLGAANSFGCNAFSAADTAAVTGKIALIDRGTCTFVVKVKNAQNAGAKGVVIVNNAAGTPPPGLGGSDATITIPTVSLTQADGQTLKNFLVYRSRTHSGLFANMLLDMNVLQGADTSGRPLLYTPNPYQSGSSVSHWDTIAFPNLLMEPNISSDLTHSVSAPHDLTLELLQDLGWN